jgi:hypothetical protein
MSEHDRGAYAPPTADAPLSFDARQPVRGARPFPVTLLISGLVLIGLVVVIFLFYRSGVREAGQAPQTVGSSVGALHTPAPADAQPQDPAAGLQIYHSEGGRPTQAPQGQPQFVPPPEAPAARPPAVAQAAPPPAAAPTTSIGQGAALRPALPPEPMAENAAPAPKAELPAKPAVAPEPKPIAAKPPPKAKPVPAAAAKPVQGAASVQIGAVSSTALADKAWSEAVAAAPGLAAGKGKGVERIEKDGHVLYRTAVTGFASKADAAAFCSKLKAAGKACFVK